MSEEKSGREPMPEFLVQYYEWTKLGPPKCCHTCFYYSMSGVCEKFKQRPPPFFVQTAGQCKDWDQDIPF